MKFCKCSYIIFMLSAFVSAYSHPHMFIDTKLEVRLSGDCFDGLEITWYFDPMFTASVINDWDSNGNGRSYTGLAYPQQVVVTLAAI